LAILLFESKKPNFRHIVRQNVLKS
jgi:hypothetical protein